MKLPVALVLLVTLVMPAAAQSQGIPGGAQQGHDDGNCVAGPIGGIIGAAVGGVVGGLVGGVNGMLGIEQRKETNRRDRRKTEKRCNSQQRR